MFKEAYNTGYNTALEKLAGKVSVPEGGLRTGWLLNDLTQLMSPKDAKLVKEELPWHRRGGPGILPRALGGGIGLLPLTYALGGSPRALLYSGLLGAGALSVLPEVLSRSGVYDSRAVAAAKAAIQEAKDKQEKE